MVINDDNEIVNIELEDDKNLTITMSRLSSKSSDSGINNPLNGINISSGSISSIQTVCTDFSNDIIEKFYDVEPKTIDIIVNFCVRPHYILLLSSVPFWVLFYLKIYNKQLIFSLSISITIFSILQTNSYIIKFIYGKQESFENLYVKKNLIIEQEDKYIIEKRFQKIFILVSIFVIFMSSFGYVYFELFSFEQTTFTPAQFFVLLFCAGISIENTQRVICNHFLSFLIKHQRYLINKANRITTETELRHLKYVV